MKQINKLDMELMDKNIWTYLLQSLQLNTEHNRHGFWTDGEEILCRTENQAESIADFLEDMGFDYVQTGYYDPIIDERNNEIDDHTGYWYVSID